MSDHDSLQPDPDLLFDRADAHIHLPNSQLADIGRGRVSTSTMYARFNAYVSWIGFQNAADMTEQRDETVR